MIFERGGNLIINNHRSRIPMIYAKRIINQAQQALMGNVPKYGVDIGM